MHRRREACCDYLCLAATISVMSVASFEVVNGAIVVFGNGMSLNSFMNLLRKTNVGRVTFRAAFDFHRD
jgi:hypothetical protein